MNSNTYQLINISSPHGDYQRLAISHYNIDVVLYWIDITACSGIQGRGP